MDFNGKDFQDFTSRCKKTNVIKNSASIASNVLCKYRNGKITLLYTDLSQSIQTTISPIVNVIDSIDSGEYSFLVPFSLFPLVFVKGTLAIDFSEFENKKLIVNKKAFPINTTDISKFPEISFKYDTSKVILFNEEFIKVIERAMPFVSHDEMRYFMNGIYLDSFNGYFNIVSTDGRRMFKEQFNIQLPFDSTIISTFNPKLIEGCNFIAKNTNTKEMVFGYGSTFINIRIIDDKFPNYQRVIPDYKHCLSFTYTNEIHETVKEVSSLMKVVSKKNDKISFYGTDENEFLIKMEDGVSNIFESRVKVKEDISKFNGNVFKFNNRYLMDMFNVLGECEVRCSPDSFNSAFTFESENGYVIIMPMIAE